MRLVPTAVPLISHEAIELLMRNGEIEVDPKRITDAEKDLSAIMREYLANEERVVQATHEALARRGLDAGKFAQVKREMADVRGLKTGDEGIASLVGQLSEFLLVSRNVEEVFVPDDLLRQKIFSVMKRHLEDDDGTQAESGP
jgi:hypothetical protein